VAVLARWLFAGRPFIRARPHVINLVGEHAEGTQLGRQLHRRAGYQWLIPGARPDPDLVQTCLRGTDRLPPIEGSRLARSIDLTDVRFRSPGERSRRARPVGGRAGDEVSAIFAHRRVLPQQVLSGAFPKGGVRRLPHDIFTRYRGIGRRIAHPRPRAIGREDRWRAAR